MNTGRKLKIYNFIRFLNQVVLLFVILGGSAVGINYLIKANEDVAKYDTLTVSPKSAVAGADVTYTFTWTKNASASGDLYRSWLRMKPQGNKFVRDTSYVPLLVSGSFRVGRDKGTYTSKTTVKAPDAPGFYIFQIRGEYQRVLGADPSVDVRESNVIEVTAAPAKDVDAQINDLARQIEELKNKPQTVTQNVRVISPSPTVTPNVPMVQTNTPTPSPAASPCAIGLFGFCLIGGR